MMATPSADDLAELETEKVRVDRETADAQPTKCMTAGLVTTVNGHNLVKFWDVGLLFVSH